MKNSRLLFALLALAGSAAVLSAGPGPQFWNRPAATSASANQTATPAKPAATIASTTPTAAPTCSTCACCAKTS